MDLDSLAELQVAQDARPYFSQELPPFYVGNCCVHHRPTITLKQLVGPDSSTASIGQAIRNSARTVNHETTMDAYNLLRQIPDYVRLQPLRFLTVKDTFTISSMLLLPEVAPSFGDIFAGNASKNGLLTIVLPAAEVAALRATLPGELIVDLPGQTLLPQGATVQRFDVEPFRKRCLVEGLDDIGLTLQHQAEITAFQQADGARRPWMTPDVVAGP